MTARYQIYSKNMDYNREFAEFFGKFSQDLVKELTCIDLHHIQINNTRANLRCLNKVIDEICLKTKRAGKMLGTASGPLSRWQKRGVDWIATGGDWGFMAAGFRNMLKERDGK